MCFGEVRKKKTGAGGAGFAILSRNCLVIVAPNMRTRNEGNRVGRPLFFDRTATLIDGLDHHVETRNGKPAGTSMAACVLPICPAPATRNVCDSLSFFFFPGNLRSTPLRTFLSAHSRIPRPLLPPRPLPPASRPGHPRRCSAGFTAVLLHRFIAARAKTFCFRAASRCCLAFVSENCTARDPVRRGNGSRGLQNSEFNICGKFARQKWSVPITIDRVIRAIDRVTRRDQPANLRPIDRKTRAKR